ncbi:MAG: M23 family metallopeptidase [Candidatus Levybacteria bacterium]|nr:M23 family metallopeptidase [Candidatus Levybacteria bacterium]
MHKRTQHKLAVQLKQITGETKAFFDFVFYYFRKKVVTSSVRFEKNKNQMVKFFLMKRGRYNRPFLHLTTMGVLGVGVLAAPFLADTYPIFASQQQNLNLIASSNAKQSVLVGEEVFQTDVSQKPRDKVLTYRVERGDTLSTIAKKFQISEETITWANDLRGDALSIGDELRILPVSGISHKVDAGETIYTVAKKYNTEPQKIADFPFNEFAGNGETLALVTGQILIVPDGIKPSEKPVIKRQVYIAQGPVPVASGGYTYPVRGGISQFYSWYHPGLDITSPIGTPLYAAHSGTVTSVSIGTYDGGYGTNVWLSNGNGIESHYAHMSNVNVSAGQRVIGGQTIVGWIGMTGRTTGPHVHFEMRAGGSYVNPLGYIR